MERLSCLMSSHFVHCLCCLCPLCATAFLDALRASVHLLSDFRSAPPFCEPCLLSVMSGARGIGQRRRRTRERLE
jgi:hypothetical protein